MEEIFVKKYHNKIYIGEHITQKKGVYIYIYICKNNILTLNVSTLVKKRKQGLGPWCTVLLFYKQ